MSFSKRDSKVSEFVNDDPLSRSQQDHTGVQSDDDNDNGDDKDWTHFAKNPNSKQTYVDKNDGRILQDDIDVPEPCQSDPNPQTYQQLPTTKGLATLSTNVVQEVPVPSDENLSIISASGSMHDIDQPVNLCCCGCGEDVSGSHHWCSISNKRVSAWCHADGAPQGFGSRYPCRTCNGMELGRKGTTDMSNPPLSVGTSGDVELDPSSDFNDEIEHIPPTVAVSFTAYRVRDSDRHLIDPKYDGASDVNAHVVAFSNLKDKLGNLHYTSWGKFYLKLLSILI